MHALWEKLRAQAPLLTDGAWGTELQARGLGSGEFPDAWNLSHPDKVAEVANAYVQAGSQVILTNTFGANRLRLYAHGLVEQVAEINRAGVEISRRAAAGRALVFASIGPTGKMLLTGETSEEELQAVFTEQANALAQAGADALVVETMSELAEAKAAVRAACATGLMVVGCMVYDSGKNKDRTMTDTEDRIHFTMWAMMAAPLIAGNDLTALSPASLATLTNKEVIAVDQDALGAQGILLWDNGGGLQVWAKPVTGGTAVALLNLSGTGSTISVDWGMIGLESIQTAAVRDLWADADLGEFTGGFRANVPSHGVTLIMVGASGSLPLQAIYEGDATANTLSGQAVVMQCPCLDGNQVGYIGNGAANSVTVENVNAPTSGRYQMNIYGSVSGTRSFLVSVDGGAPVQASLTGTSFSLPVTSGMTVQLNSGANSIEFSNSGAWAPNLDHIAVSSPGVAGPGFNIVYPAADVTILSSGQSGTASINLVPSGGFTGNVALACVLPAAMTGAGCSSTGASLSGTAAVAAWLTITTTAPTSVAMQAVRRPSGLRRELPGELPPVPGVALVWLSFSFGRSRRKRMLFHLSFWMTAILAIQLTACSGGGSGSGAGPCLTVPNAPGSLAAASITISGAQLSWTPGGAASNCAVSGYTVYQNNRPIATAASASYGVAGLSASTTYSFSVAATDTYGTSAQSAPLNVTTASATHPTPPGTYPVKVIATSGSVTQTASFNVIVQ